MSLSAGARVGPYEILALLGKGGMGEVYRAHDTRLNRPVAIKILTTAPGGSPTSLKRFQREAHAIARLNHSHICTLHDVGENEGIAFLVMELLDGETLADRLDRGAIPIRESLEIATQIADALDAAHGKGVVHRDLKPGNVMLTPAGVKLLDFGLAKLRESDPDDAVRAQTESVHLTDRGLVVGTVPYMAPEQIEGHEVDTRTDLFSFGVLLYEMLAGARPFTGDSRASLMAAIVTADPPPLAARMPAIPPVLDRVIRRCLAKDPEQRWQTARDLAAELRWVADGESAPRVAASMSPRRRGRWLLAAALVVLAVAGIALSGAIASRRHAIAQHLQVTYRRGTVTSARFAPDGRTFVYTASWDGRPYEIFLGRPENPDARSLGLDSARILSISRASDMAVLFGPQNIEQVYGARTLARVPMAGGGRRDLLTGVVDADWIPGTDTYAVIRDPGGNRPWTIEFPVGTKVHEARAAWSLRVSPDGNRIAFFEGPLLFDSSPEAMVTVIDRSGTRSTLSKGWSGMGLAWAPSGREVWFTATHGGVVRPGDSAEPDRSGPQLQAVSLSGEERTVHTTPDWVVLHDIAADGRVLLSRNSIRIGLACQPRGDTSERELGWLTASFARSLSSDGRTVIFIDALTGRNPSGRPSVFRRDMDGSPAVSVGEGNAAALSPNGQWVLTIVNRAFALLPTGAGSVTALPKGNLQGVNGGAWLPDSKHIVFTGVVGNQQRVYLQEIPNGAPIPITPEGTVAGLASVRDARTLLVRSRSGWHLSPIDGGDVAPFPALSANDFPVTWSADGRSVYTVDIVPGVRPTSVTVFRIDAANGRREVWKTLGPADTVGVEALPVNFRMLPDGSAYCYSYMRRLGDLFLVAGLK